MHSGPPDIDDPDPPPQAASAETARRSARGDGDATRVHVEVGDAERIEAALDEEGHAEAVAAIREAIARGDVYQVCFTLRARLAAVSGATLYRALARSSPRFLAWVRLPSGEEIVSASPELFFAIEGRAVRSEPMKGTGRSAAALLASEKDEAELAMITDLLRNDLRPVCEEGSVRVVASRRSMDVGYATQTVSEIAGTLVPGVTHLDVLAALHPGGSITGAPKRAAMDAIAALERTPRGAYTGTLGWVDGERGVFSLLIRTAHRVRGGDAWTYGVGGGITWRSNAAEELAEARAKLGALGR